MIKRKYIQLSVLVLMATSVFFLAGCYKQLVPKEKDYFSNDASFNRTDFDPKLGQTNVFLHGFNPDYSTQPLDFVILNCERADTVYLTTDSTKYRVDSVPAPYLQQKIKVSQWSTYYSGKEKSIEEINAKKYDAERPVLDIRPHSGDIFFWRTDASVVPPGRYFFDVKVSNGGGQKVYHMTMRVKNAHPYEPYNYDDITGERLPARQGGIIHPSNMNGVEDRLGRPMPADSVDISFHQTGTAKNTLTIKFEDEDGQAIPLSKFNKMEWDSLTYYSNMTGKEVPFGFNRRMNNDSTSVTWDIPNPFPVLLGVSGFSPRAEINFRYDRVSFGKRVRANINFVFAIMAPGEWELVYKFRINPKFEDD